MSYTVQNLIVDAYNKSGIVPRGYKTVTGEQSKVGLQLFNEILSDKTVDDSMLLYYTKYDFDFIAGTSEYFIPLLNSIETFTFFITGQDGSAVRYSMAEQNIDKFWNTPRAEGIESLPLAWNFQREKGGGRLFLYFSPNLAYPGQIWGQFQLESVTQFEDLNEVFEAFYRSFLCYELAERLCEEYNFETPMGVHTRLLKYRRIISKRSAPLDLNAKTITTFTSGMGFNYAQTNIGKGYTVP